MNKKFKDFVAGLLLMQVTMSLFDNNTNTTGQTGAGQDLSGEMKTF